VLLLSAYNDSEGKTLLFNEGLEIISNSLAVPLYHLWEHGIGEGILGGKVISHYNQGRTAAGIALEIINGTSIQDIEVLESSPNQYAFDYNQLQKHMISLMDLPEQSEIMNNPFSYYLENKRIIWTTVTTISVLAIALFLAIINILKRRKIEIALRHSEERFKQLTTNLPLVMIYQLAMYPDGSRKMLFLSENVKELNLVSQDSVLADVTILYSQIVPEMRDYVAKKENAALRN